MFHLLYTFHMEIMHHGIEINFCLCKSKIEQLIELNLWPETPHSPQVAFSIEYHAFISLQGKERKNTKNQKHYK